jgi:uncharacterized protein (TIGR02594 family)
MQMMDSDPLWLKRAWIVEGQKEFPGPASNTWIEKLWLGKPGGRWFWEEVGKRDDSKLPWCGAFAADCFEQADMPFPKHYARARAWADFGVDLGRPIRGCVVVIQNGAQWHVGFVVGETATGDLLVIGGNQNDSVKVSKFKRSSARAYRWPLGAPYPNIYELARGDAAASTSEA